MYPDPIQIGCFMLLWGRLLFAMSYTNWALNSSLSVLIVRTIRAQHGIVSLKQGVLCTAVQCGSWPSSVTCVTVSIPPQTQCPATTLLTALHIGAPIGHTPEQISDWHWCAVARAGSTLPRRPQVSDISAQPAVTPRARSCVQRGWTPRTAKSRVIGTLVRWDYNNQRRRYHNVTWSVIIFDCIWNP